MSAVPFDTLKLARRLEAAGFPPKQAADTAEALADALTPDLATKQDIKDLRTDMVSGFRDLEQKLTIRLGGLIVAGVAALAAIKFFG